MAKLVSDPAYIAADVIVNPDKWFAAAGTLVRLPKIVLFDDSDFLNFVGTSFDPIAAFGPIANKLLAAKVMVARCRSIFAPGTVLRMFLPHEAQQNVSDTTINGTFTFQMPLVTPGNWKGGSILYLGGLCPLSATDGISAELDVLGGGHIDEFVNTDAFAVAAIKAAQARYQKFAYHLAYTLPTLADVADSRYTQAAHDRFAAIVSNVVAGAAVAGVSITTLDGAWPGNFGPGNIAIKAAVEADWRAKVLSFFGL